MGKLSQSLMIMNPSSSNNLYHSHCFRCCNVGISSYYLHTGRGKHKVANTRYNILSRYSTAGRFNTEPRWNSQADKAPALSLIGCVNRNKHPHLYFPTSLLLYMEICKKPPKLLLALPLWVWHEPFQVFILMATLRPWSHLRWFQLNTLKPYFPLYSTLSSYPSTTASLLLILKEQKPFWNINLCFLVVILWMSSFCYTRGSSLSTLCW